MSFWIVGKALIPPNEKTIVPKARDKDMNVGLSCSATFFSAKFVIMAAEMITAPRAVAEAAATAAGLADRKERKDSELFNAHIYVLNIAF